MGTLAAIGGHIYSGGALGTPYVPPTPIAYDTFTDTNSTNLSAHTSDSGHSWAVQVGAIEIQTNRATIPVSTQSAYALDLSAAAQPTRALVDAKDTGTAAASVSFAIRSNTAAADLLLMEITVNPTVPTTTIKIIEVIAGSTTTQSSDVFAVDNTAAINAGITIEAIDNGSSVTFRSTEIGVSTTWSAAPSAPYKSVRIIGNNVTKSFDNLEVYG